MRRALRAQLPSCRSAAAQPPPSRRPAAAQPSARPSVVPTLSVMGERVQLAGSGLVLALSLRPFLEFSFDLAGVLARVGLASEVAAVDSLAPGLPLPVRTGRLVPGGEAFCRVLAVQRRFLRPCRRLARRRLARVLKALHGGHIDRVAHLQEGASLVVFERVFGGGQKAGFRWLVLHWLFGGA